MGVKSKNPATANQVFDRLLEKTVNFALSRTSLVGFPVQRNAWSLDVDPRRNLDEECRYIPGEPTLRQYRMMVDQEGVADRIVSAYPDECWSVYPELYEEEGDTNTRFERAWQEIEDRLNPWHYLHRLDAVSGIGHYGIMLIGLDDNSDLTKPAPGFTQTAENPAKRPEKGPNLLYFQTFSEDLVRIKEFDTSYTSPRCHLPLYYSIRMTDPTNYTETGVVEPEKWIEVVVHWSRVLHYSDSLKTSSWCGVPRLRNLHRRVYDIRKILGSSAEMFYKGGFPGTVFETLPEYVESGTVDMKSVKREIDAYSEGLQRYMRLIGMTAKNLAVEIADPESQLTQQYTYIAATLGMPLPVFLGQIEGHAAGGQNMEYWRTRLRRRQNLTLSPLLIRPFVRRLIAYGVLPKPKDDSFIVNWKDLGTLSDKDKADIALKKAQALLQYVTSGSWKLIPPKMFFTEVLQLTQDEAEAIIASAGGEDAITGSMQDLIDTQAGNTPESTGTDPAASTGAGGRTNGLGRGAKNRTKSRRRKATGNG